MFFAPASESFDYLKAAIVPNSETGNKGFTSNPIKSNEIFTNSMAILTNRRQPDIAPSFGL